MLVCQLHPIFDMSYHCTFPVQIDSQVLTLPFGLYPGSTYLKLEDFLPGNMTSVFSSFTDSFHLVKNFFNLADARSNLLAMPSSVCAVVSMAVSSANWKTWVLPADRPRIRRPLRKSFSGRPPFQSPISHPAPEAPLR